MAIERYFGIRGSDNDFTGAAKIIFRTIFTFLLVIIGWVIFRAPSLGDAMNMYEGMIGMNGFAFSDAMNWQIKGLAVTMMIVGMAIIFIGPTMIK